MNRQKDANVGFIELVSPERAVELVEMPGVRRIAEHNRGSILYELADGKALLTVYDLQLSDDSSAENGVELVLGGGQLWESAKAYEASARAPSTNRGRKPAHVLTGVFDSPNIVTLELDVQKELLRQELSLDFDPATDEVGLAFYEARLPKNVDDYDVSLLRAAASILSESVRFEVRGTYSVVSVQRDPPVWAPFILPRGGGERLLPAGRYLSSFLDGKVPSLVAIYRMFSRGFH